MKFRPFLDGRGLLFVLSQKLSATARQAAGRCSPRVTASHEGSLSPLTSETSLAVHGLLLTYCETSSGPTQSSSEFAPMQTMEHLRTASNDSFAHGASHPLC